MHNWPWSTLQRLYEPNYSEPTENIDQLVITHPHTHEALLPKEIFMGRFMGRSRIMYELLGLNNVVTYNPQALSKPAAVKEPLGKKKEMKCFSCSPGVTDKASVQGTGVVFVQQVFQCSPPLIRNWSLFILDFLLLVEQGIFDVLLYLYGKGNHGHLSTHYDAHHHSSQHIHLLDLEGIVVLSGSSSGYLHKFNTNHSIINCTEPYSDWLYNHLD